MASIPGEIGGLPPNFTFDLEAMTQQLEELDHDEPVFIHVGGVSASGKSTFARYLGTVLEDAKVLPIDAYLVEGLSDPNRHFDHTPPDPNRPYIGGISPDIWELDLLEDHLQQLAKKRAVQIPVFNETIKDRVGYEQFAPSRHIILEGGHTFSERFRDEADYRILVVAPFHDRVTRKIVRTHREYHRTDIEEVLDRYCTKDEPVQQFYRAEHESIANQIVNNRADPIRDYSWLEPTGLPETQGEFNALVPKLGYGVLHPEEMFGFITKTEGGSNLRYEVAGKRLVDLPIPELTLEYMAEYYDVGSEA
jgi:uridine kinase